MDGAAAGDAPRADGAAGDGGPDAPTGGCATVLVYGDCDPVLSANCASIADPLRADAGAAAIGLVAVGGAVHDQAAFRARFDAGGFEAIAFESSSYFIDPETAARLASWVASGGRLVFSDWDLDGSSAPAVATTLRDALMVTTPASFDTPASVHADPTAPVDLLDRVATLPPLGFSNIGIDDGDELATTAGFLAARFTSAAGPGAIAVTHAGRVVVLGFLPIELVYQLVRDADADGTPDVEELYANVLDYLCNG